MISGVKSRFTYLDDLASYTGISQVIIALHDTGLAVDAESFSGSPSNKPVSPPYPLDETSIRRHYTELGAESVVVRYVDSSEIDSFGSLSAIYSDPSLNLFPSDPVRLKRNMRMLALRSLAFSMVLDAKPDFDLLLFKREDNYFLDRGDLSVRNFGMFCRGERLESCG
ncbi:hypothetical protein TrRE_jg12054 [Triparma retinervis]|uniref:Uncharacterized protein n=1 Tax=Triparma retinervis TaxID=2557542 RepID=A0A9W6Z6W7_9STRA|nr:hypothetical protein TrRE_jg12054 [Triparma retinervis]